jgi:hypothetical protein
VQGAAKTKIGDPRGPWWVGGSKAKKGPGSDLFLVFFNDVFKLPLPKNVQKRDYKNREKIGFRYFVDFFAKRFLWCF